MHKIYVKSLQFQCMYGIINTSVIAVSQQTGMIKKTYYSGGIYHGSIEGIISLFT